MDATVTPSHYPADVETIVAALSAKITSGELATGSRLPTQANLATAFGTSRHTIRRAIAVLEQRGLVRGRQGSGVFVAGSLIDYYVKSRTRYNDNVQGLTQTSRIEVLDLQCRRVSPLLAKDLSISPRARIFELHLLRWNGPDPLCVARHSFPAARFPDLPERVTGIGGITELIRSFGVEDFKRSDTAISARHPSAAEARMLRIPPDSPVVVLEGRNVDPEGRPIEISTSIWPASRIRVHV